MNLILLHEFNLILSKKKNAARIFEFQLVNSSFIVSLDAAPPSGQVSLVQKLEVKIEGLFLKRERDCFLLLG